MVSALGHAGLIPFALSALAAWWDPARHTFWLEAVNAYGAVILSFVGALHWGLAMGRPDWPLAQRQRAFGWSVVPAVLGWLALLTPHAGLTASILIAGFAAQLWQDSRLRHRAGVPPWFWPLRVRLTVGAVLSLAVAGAAAI